jgi:hypothetical protein
VSAVERLLATIASLQGQTTVHRWLIIGLSALLLIVAVCTAYNAGDMHRDRKERKKLEARLKTVEEVLVGFAGNTTAPQPPEIDADARTAPIPVQRPSPHPRTVDGPTTEPADAVPDKKYAETVPPPVVVQPAAVVPSRKTQPVDTVERQIGLDGQRFRFRITEEQQ